MSQSNTIAGAITYPTKNDKDEKIDGEIKQPKQPTNLQGLLKFAMEATKMEDAPQESHFGPLDEDRKKFLETALNSMTIDVIEILQNKIKILQNAGSLTADSDISQHKEALETILEHVDNIDTANDFHKIGGFTIFQPCLKCVNPEIRAGSCDVLAELCQNNPYCQRVVLDSGLIPSLLRILASDSNDQVCVKALYAISCIVRQNSEGYHQLIQHEGLTILLKTFQKNHDKLRTKTAFLLSSLCRSQPDLMSRLVFLEYIPVLISLLGEERMPSHEHILALLLLLAEENQSASYECKSSKYKLEDVLKQHLQVISNNEEYQEEEMYCRQLITHLFCSSNGL